MTGLYILVVSATGGALVFRSEMQRASAPRLFHEATPGTPRAPVATVARALEAAYPDYRLVGVDAPTAMRRNFLAYEAKGDAFLTVFVDASTGEVLGELPPQLFVARLQEWHVSLMAGPKGRTANGIGAFCLLLLAASGVIVWWPGLGRVRRALGVRFGGSWKRVTWELHGAVGIWSAALLMMWAVTGASFIFSKPFRAIVSRLSTLTVAPRLTSDVELAGRRPAPELGSLIATAAQALPDAEFVRVVMPATDRAPLLVVMTHPGVTRAQDDSNVSFFFDQYSGVLLQRWDAAPRTAGDHVMAAIVPLHFGGFGGTGVRIAWALAGLSPAVLFATGALMWWTRVVAGRRRS